MSIKAVITGGASGIGYATAKKPLADGGTVCLLDMNEKAPAAAQHRPRSHRGGTATGAGRHAAAQAGARRAGGGGGGGDRAAGRRGRSSGVRGNGKIWSSAHRGPGTRR